MVSLSDNYDVAGADVALDGCVMQEIKRWSQDRSHDFETMINQFAGLQVAFHERCRDVWLETAEQFPHLGDKHIP